MPRPILPALPADLCQSRGWLLRGIGRAYLRLAGWRVEGVFPTESRFVLIVAPHTSNWDFFLGVAAVLAMEMKASWLGKHSIFRFPVRGLLRALGGIPVDRRANFGVVGECVKRFEEAPALLLALSPEGTRRSGGKWRSGFYQIATQARVPILPVGFDFQAHVIRLLPVFRPTGDLEAELPRLQALFEPAWGLRTRKA